VTRYLTLAILATVIALAAAAALPDSRPALIGAGLATGTGCVSLLGIRLVGRSAARPLQRALAVFVVMFMVRLVLVSLGLIAVHRLGDSVIAYVVAFFVPYFVFAAIEGGYVHALGRRIGRTA
jgi:hypothetical protein